MKSYKRVPCVLVVAVLLGASAACAEVNWTFDVGPYYAVAKPGGTIQWTYDITNDISSTEPIIPLMAGASWTPSLSTLPIADAGLDLAAWSIGPIMPGASVSGDFFHITFAPDAPIGTTVEGAMFLLIGNGSASPPYGVRYPYEAKVVAHTPELPPGLLGALAFVPFGYWRLRLRRGR